MAIIIQENNMYIRKGDSGLINLIFYETDDTSDSGTRTDITDSIVYLTVKVPAEDENIIIQKIVTLHEDSINGVTAIELTSEDTNITPRTYYFDIQISMPDGQVNTIFPQDPDIIGKFFVKKGVT